MREFLETYPLYRPFNFDVPTTLDRLPKLPIRMSCGACGNEQTFLMINEFWEGKSHRNYAADGEIVLAKYVCAHCQTFKRTFAIHLSTQNKTITKIGQFPAWDISGDRNVEAMLGSHKILLRRGLISESQGYGIGAFAYYRRIVEETIDQLLDEIPLLLSGDELELYKDALAKTKSTRVAAEKIQLVKDLLPSSLRPDGMNPLKVLHEVLSEGLHGKTDEDCMRDAEVIRNVMTFLAAQLDAAAGARKSFTEGMRNLLDRKARPPA